MKYGLNDQDLTYIVLVSRSFREIKKAVIFGPRAKGLTNGFRYDIAIFGDNISFSTVAELHERLGGRTFPYKYI